MKFFSKSKDGGPASNVTAYWLCEIKSLFSVALLRFDHGSRDAYHSHAFGSISWLLRGRLDEQLLDDPRFSDRYYDPSARPIVTRRSTFHRVWSEGRSWVLTFRGPWSKTWREFDPITMQETTLTHGREVVP